MTQMTGIVTLLVPTVAERHESDEPKGLFVWELVTRA